MSRKKKDVGVNQFRPAHRRGIEYVFLPDTPLCWVDLTLEVIFLPVSTVTVLIFMDYYAVF